MNEIRITLTRAELIEHFLAVAAYWGRQQMRGEELIAKTKAIAGDAYTAMIDASNRQSLDKMIALQRESLTFAGRLVKPRWWAFWESNDFHLTREECIRITYPIDMLLATEAPTEYIEGMFKASGKLGALVDIGSKGVN